MSIFSTKPTPNVLESRLVEFNDFTTGHGEIEIPFKGAMVKGSEKTKIVNESSVHFHDILESLDATASDKGILQIFRASMDNIQDVRLMLRGEPTSASKVLIESGEVLGNWTSSNINLMTVSQSAGGFINGSIQFNGEANDSSGSYGQKTFSPAQNWSTKTNLEFRLMSDAVMTIRLGILDSSLNEATYDIVTPGNGNTTWDLYDIPFSSFSNISLVDLTDITYLRLYFIVAAKNDTVGIDEVYVEGSDGTVVISSFELYDFGTTANPTSLTQGTLLTLDSGASSYQKNLTTQKKLSGYSLTYGVNDPLKSLTIGNYYGILIKKPTEGIIEVYGDVSDNHNTSGGR